MVGLDFVSAMMTPVNKLLIVVMASVPDPDPDPDPGRQRGASGF